MGSHKEWQDFQRKIQVRMRSKENTSPFPLDGNSCSPIKPKEVSVSYKDVLFSEDFQILHFFCIKGKEESLVTAL